MGGLDNPHTKISFELGANGSLPTSPEKRFIHADWRAVSALVRVLIHPHRPSTAEGRSLTASPLIRLN